MTKTTYVGKTPNPAIRTAAEAVGGIPRLAQLLGVAEGTIYQWASGDRPVPFPRAIEIDRLTQGAVRCERIVPDAAKLVKYLRASGRATKEPAEVA